MPQNSSPKPSVVYKNNDNQSPDQRNSDTGFYSGFNKYVAISAKLLVGLLILWTVTNSKDSAEKLLEIQAYTISHFGGWYIYVTAFYLITCLALAVIPRTGRIKLGKDDEKPEFSNFSWFSMMFGAGVGVGMLTYATGEPIFHFQSNPDVLKGATQALSENNIAATYKWTLLHYGLTPWAAYGIVGMALAYFSYNKGMPLTMRSALTPLFGKYTNGVLGNIIDVIAILATIIGVGVTIGLGVKQFVFGAFYISDASWILDEDGQPTLTSLYIALAIVTLASMLSALSGVGRGIKWLSNLNMVLSVFLLLFFLFFGSALFALKWGAIGMLEYIKELPIMSFTVWPDDGTELGKSLFDWQGAWTIYYWAWWIAFAPFVGIFLCRVSRGRSIREYVLGAIIVPSLMCFTWFFLAGGAALDLELSGIAKRALVDADLSSRLFVTVQLILNSQRAVIMSAIIVVLLLTYLITSADSAILVVNTIAASSERPKNYNKMIIIWSLILGGIIAALLNVGGLGALQAAMIVGALPFSVVMALMTLSLIKAFAFDHYKK